MSQFSTDQMYSATIAQLDGQLALWHRLAGKVFESVEKVIETNASVTRTALEESSMLGKRFLSVSNPGEFISLVVAQTRPNLESTLAYGRQLSGIASAMPASMAETMQAHFAETGHRMETVIEGLGSDGPDGSRIAIEVLTSAIDNANANYAQFAKSAKEFSATMQSTLLGAADGHARHTGKTGRPARR